ncbi:MAG: carboxylesterase family protein [Faecalibacterium sp.]
MNKHCQITRRTFLKTSAAAAAAAPFSARAQAAAPQEEVENDLPGCVLRRTQYGPVRGTQSGNALVWYGIPYACAPSGELRWHAPVSPSAWILPKDCTVHSLAACQSGCLGTEDCLKLDVYAAPGAKHLPVLVYLHGGGNQSGSTRELPGGRLALQADCVFVSVEFRLGLLGFNCLPALCSEPEASGNFALLDIAHALDWVQENIAAFGGDPANVTVCGFSSGGRDVLAMLYSPLFSARFHKAVSLSGGMTCADPALSAQQIAAALAPLTLRDGLFSDADAARNWLLSDTDAVRNWLYSLDAQELSALSQGAALRMNDFPHLYADGIVLPRAGFAASPIQNVPLLLVASHDEFSLFAAEESALSDSALSAHPESERSAARKFASGYGSALYRAFNLQNTAQTLFAAGYAAPVYLCQLDYGSAHSRTPIPVLGAFHGICLPMLSEQTACSALADLRGAGYQAMGQIFISCLRRFMHTGTPSGTEDPLFWPAWTPEAPRSLVLDADGQEAFVECRDVTVPLAELLDQMERDASLSPALRERVVQNVLRGRFFSGPLDER